MKNYLVILVTIGIGLAYWYQMPEAPKPVEAAATPPPAPVVKTFVPSHSVLEDPAVTVGGRGTAQSSVLLGNDKPSKLHP